MSGVPRGVRFGTAYYPEYQPYERLATDLDLMVEAGINVIRVGESVWSTWEPRQGEFDLEWLAPVLDGAQQRGISAIIGTPTYAVPPWLRRTYPETTAHSATGVEIPYGARQDVDYSHPAFRHLAERLIRKIIERYRDHPAVIGWQVDNEPGHKLFYNHPVFQGFLEFLRKRYGDVASLNTRWGLAYWSHRLSEWADLWPPDGNSTPSYDLAWRRYQAELTHDFIAWQADLVRGLVPADHFVTTCVALGQVGLDITEVGLPLDVVGTNVYYATQDGLELPGPEEPSGGLYPFFVGWGGPAWLYLQADLSRGTRQQPFLVTETNASSIGGSADNFPAYAGQLRQVVWALVARGARLVEYWHWHSLHYGAETYWGGILPHSLQPGRIYRELAEVGAELHANAELINDLSTVSDGGLLISAESRWAMEFMGPLRGAGSRCFGDPHSYERIVAAFFRGLFDAGLSVDVLAPQQLPADADEMARRWPVLVVPGLDISDDATLEGLKAYAVAGGHLVLTPRTGYADEEAVARHEVMPGILREAAGLRYDEFTNLTGPVQVTATGQATITGTATGWADGLIAEGASVLAGYEHPHLRQFAAVTTNTFGAGRVTYVGTVPDRELSRSLALWITTTSLSEDAWRTGWPSPVRCTSSLAADGRVLHFVHNWSWEPAQFTVPAQACPMGSRTPIEAGAVLSLGPWDVQILVESAGEPRA
jgi:beta-galactosidase